MFWFFPFPTFFLRPPQLFSHLPCPAIAPSIFTTLYRRRDSLRGHEFLGRFSRVYAIEGEFSHILTYAFLTLFLSPFPVLDSISVPTAPHTYSSSLIVRRRL